ncbi:MAG: type II secretion system F family protein [Chitinispirillales bacterium]|jgi:type IV pilus assembly protein PilC|nr:type II secretion system F family protein [Chitinispirillales bacterium]
MQAHEHVDNEWHTGLDTALNHLAEYRMGADALRRKTKGVMAYPAAAVFLAFLTAASVFIFMPSMFAGMNDKLSLPAQIIMQASNFFTTWRWVLILTPIVAAAAVWCYGKTKRGRYGIDSVKLRLPIIGEFERKRTVSRFSRALSELLLSGAPAADETIAAAAGAVGNVAFCERILRAFEESSDSDHRPQQSAKRCFVTKTLGKTNVFPPMTLHIISAAEKNGDMVGTFRKIADFYREEAEAAAEALMFIAGPMAICVMGAIIGGILAATLS